MENIYKEVFCTACFGTQRQMYIGKQIENEIYDKFVCCLCGHENKIKVSEEREIRTR